MLIITIKQGKEKSLLQGEPWIYVSMVARVDGKYDEKMKSGTTALVRSSSGQFLARASWSPKSQIQARVWSFDEKQAIDHAFIKRRVQTALAKQPMPIKPDGRQRRLINAEQDGLPGLLVDHYGAAPGYLVCQFQAAGVDAWKVTIVQTLIALTGCPNVFEYADELVRKGEGLPVTGGVLAGEEPPQAYQP
ncbi:SAM-dependent methyltransferase [Undibacterium sp. Jales W-56]|uniref:SAM-dependent methyltransferase n=1 Tax=Undibacterium sp. Jales W-56 TaxID=2897325 RepID=UPI0021D1B194|nr:SAM-dependent methyltransferase [Undibacterium sp. Jales W-56]MCU6434315.1 SAM-dependent methyltransferase [Undibacterium sp. Jales W-56]